MTRAIVSVKHSSKLPPDDILKALIRFGFRVGDIAERFDVDPQRVSEAKKRMGLEMIPPGKAWRRNGAKPACRYFG